MWSLSAHPRRPRPSTGGTAALILWIAWFCACLSPAVLWSSGTQAQGAAPSPEVHQAYQDLIGRAVAHFDGGHLSEALVLFRQAHELVPSARTLRGIGLVQFARSDYAAAIVALEASLADERRPLTAAQRTEVDETLARARGFVSPLLLTANPPADRVLVDGVEVDEEATYLNPGRHQIVLELAGHRTVDRTVVVDGGSPLEVDVQFEPLVVAEGPRVGEPPEPEGVPIHIVGNEPGLTLHAVPLDGGSQSREVCTAPCETRLLPGSYRFGVSRSLEAPLQANEAELDGPSDVLVEFHSRTVFQIIGWVLLPVTLIGAPLLAIPTSTWDQGLRTGLVVGGLVVGLTATTALTQFKDGASVEVTPRGATHDD